MQTVSLTVQHSWELAAALTVVGGALALSKNNRVRNGGAFARETAVIGFLYGLWHKVGELASAGTSGAFRNAHWIERVEHDLFLPSERSVQQLFLGNRLLIEEANLYYATMHLTTMLIFLIWLFVRHRDRYRPVRQVMAWTTLACLLVQLVPVAPPRMLHGIVDTGLLYHQSVYNGLPIDQLSSMPSVHVAWAVLVGYYTWRVSTSRWRYLGPAHSVATIFFVVVTGNHFWLDGVVAVAILAFCAWAVYGARTAWHALRNAAITRFRRRSGATAPDAAPVAQDAGLVA